MESLLQDTVKNAINLDETFETRWDMLYVSKHLDEFLQKLSSRCLEVM